MALRTVDLFTPRKIRLAVVAQLEGIRFANGYQTQPRVVTDIRQLKDRGSAEQHMLYVGKASLVPNPGGAPRLWQCSYSLGISGQTSCGQGDPQDLSEALLQDTLNALTQEASIAALATSIGKGFAMEFSGADFDEPWLTLEDGLDGWTVTMTCGFMQSPPW